MVNRSTAFPCNVTTTVTGPAGALEAITTCPPGEPKGIAIVCHPHPLYGGTMHNKVVHTLARGFGELGFRTVRFNFRGIGASAGRYGQGVGEAEDTLAILKWARTHGPQEPLWLAGFSFGAFMALRAAMQFSVARLVLVAPPVQNYPELGPPPVPQAPVLVLQGDSDDVVSPAAVKAWSDSIAPPATLRVIPAADHFFHGRLNDLRAALLEILGPVVATER
jgi:alpha/beta superfamily hydrolase